jgi:hypothetical protein
MEEITIDRRMIMDSTGRSGTTIRYQIQIRGKLDLKWSEWFDGFLFTHTNGETVLEGAVADQSALYGILAKIHDLGLTLLCVERLSKESNRLP